jgi:hypothetical protein
MSRPALFGLDLAFFGFPAHPIGFLPTATGTAEGGAPPKLASFGKK